jgi:hypothetical protein
MEMNWTKRSVVLVRRWLMSVKQDLELVPTAYSLIRLVIDFHATKALRGIHGAVNAPSRQLGLLHMILDINSNHDG